MLTRQEQRETVQEVEEMLRGKVTNGMPPIERLRHAVIDPTHSHPSQTNPVTTTRHFAYAVSLDFDAVNGVALFTLTIQEENPVMYRVAHTARRAFVREDIGVGSIRDFIVRHIHDPAVADLVAEDAWQLAQPHAPVTLGAL